MSVDTGITSVNVSGQELADHHGRSFKRSMPKSEAAQADNKPALQRSELSAVLSSAIDAVDDVAGIASDAVDAGGEFTGRYPDWQVSCDASTRLLAEISAIDQLTKFIGQRELADAGAGAAVPPRSPHRTNSSKIQTPALSTVTQQLSDPSAVIPRTVINDGCTSNFSRELSGVDDTRKIRDELRAEIARVVFHVCAPLAPLFFMQMQEFTSSYAELILSGKISYYTGDGMIFLAGGFSIQARWLCSIRYQGNG